MRDGHLVSVFKMWLSGFPSTICQRGWPFSSLENQMAAAVWLCLRILYSVSLVHSESFSAPVLCWLASVALELRSASGTSAGC